MILMRLIYTSTASPGVSFKDLKDILLKAENNNYNSNVTGILCYGQGAFLQVLEGSRKTVTELFLKISADKRHQDVRLIEMTPILERSFLTWSMKLATWENISDEKKRTLLMRFFPSTEFNPLYLRPEQCFKFLQTLSAN